MTRLFTTAVLAALIGLPVYAPSTIRQSGSEQKKLVTSNVDLVQVTLIVPKKVKIGKTFTVMDSVENQGGSLAGNSKTYFYLSKDDVLDKDDVVVGGRRVPNLGANQSHETITPVTLKPEIEPGEYYFIAMADAPKDLEERYRENNMRAVKVTVQPADEKKK